MGGLDLRVLDCSENNIKSLDISNCSILIDTYKNGSRSPLLNDGTSFYYYLDDAGPYTLSGSGGVKYKFRSMLITDAGVTVNTGEAPAATPTPSSVRLYFGQDGKTLQAAGSYGSLYARVALVLDNNGVSGLYVTQATINADGTIVIPAFMVPGLTVKGVNVALVPTIRDITSSTPNVVTSVSRMS